MKAQLYIQAINTPVTDYFRILCNAWPHAGNFVALPLGLF